MFASLEAALLPIVVNINTYLSNYILIVLLVAVGLWYSIKTRFVQVRCFGEGSNTFSIIPGALGKEDKIFAGDLDIDLDCIGGCMSPTLFEGLDQDEL